MKPPILLKTILDILLILLVLSVSTTFILFIISLFTNSSMPMEVNNRSVETLNASTITLISISFLFSILSVYIIFLLRKLIRSFFKLKFYTRLQVSLFNLIGQLIIVTAIGRTILNFFSLLLLEGKAKLGIEVDTSFDNLLFILAIGLFFIYMSKIFENARTMKEENELTV